MNEAVERAHVSGILTAASLMVAGDAAADAAERARRLPDLGVGLHVVLAEGRPVLPPEQVPALVSADGCFHADMVRTAFAIALSPAARAQMREEVAAQFAAFAATGLRLDHVNAHKHFHMHPMIMSAILHEGRKHGMHAVRVPYSPDGAGFGAAVMRWWAGLLSRRLRAHGIATNDRVAGLAQTGAFDTAHMRAAIAALGPGLTEIYTHPATVDDWAGAAPGYRYRDELAALTDEGVRAALAASGARSGPFALWDRSATPGASAPASSTPPTMSEVA